MEIWHADADGEYSGVQGHSGTWLRGIQRANSSGCVRFETIFPGWYRGRTPHIHMKVLVSGDEVHTGQVFFGTTAKHAVYAQGRYAARGQSDISNRQAGHRALLTPRRKPSRISAGSLTIGVSPRGGR